ncbi:hypothetical protein WICPIJ_007379 [Wickerhamomyces pijperi]|uniref:C2H2-type domain-containing protein n=1 Tax=Wickerhamomyces pijperi TaxID=599730 RepID=A0A9P8Q0C7_WICPI|nr:hypothetical protein WICPIJ_007379 [Wickerhamomyces pijperi]
MENNSYPDGIVSFKKFSFSGTNYSQRPNNGTLNFQQYPIPQPYNPLPRDSSSFLLNAPAAGHPPPPPPPPPPSSTIGKESITTQGSGQFIPSSGVTSPSYFSNPSFLLPRDSSSFLLNAPAAGHPPPPPPPPSSTIGKEGSGQFIPSSGVTSPSYFSNPSFLSTLGTQPATYEVPYPTSQFPVFQPTPASSREHPVFQLPDTKFPNIHTSRNSSIVFQDPFKESKPASPYSNSVTPRTNSSSTHMMLKYRSSFSQFPTDLDSLPSSFNIAPEQGSSGTSSKKSSLLESNDSRNKLSVDYTKPAIHLSLQYPEAVLKSHSSTPPTPLLVPSLSTSNAPSSSQLLTQAQPLKPLQVTPQIVPTKDNKFLIKPLKKRRSKGDPPLEYRCPCCPKVYDKLNNLKSHLATHSTARPYVCKYCQRGFARNYDCKRHQLLHEKGKR